MNKLAVECKNKKEIKIFLNNVNKKYPKIKVFYRTPKEWAKE